MSKLLTLFFLIIIFIFTCIYQYAHASNDLEKWNSPQGQLIRQKSQQKLNTTTYREVDSFQVRDVKNVSPQKMNKQIGLNVEHNGSRAGVTIDALKDKNVSTTAKKWANELGKGAVRFTAGAILAEAAVQAMLDSVGWIIDEGGKVTFKENPDGSNCESFQACSAHHTLWQDGNYPQFGIFTDRIALAKYSVSQRSPTHKGTHNYRVINDCVYYDGIDGNGNAFEGALSMCGGAISNPAYDPKTTPPSLEVPEKEIEETLKDYLNDPNTPQNIKDVFHTEAEKPSGKAKIWWSDDPSSAVEIFADDKDIVGDILKSNDPVGDGHTDKVPDISTGTEGETDTTPKENPEPEFITDPLTGNKIPNPNYNPNYDPGTTSKSNWPALCDYAFKFCEWMDWTQEPPESDEEEVSQVQIKEIDVTDFDKEDHVTFGAYCPFKKQFETWHMGILGAFSFEYDLSFFCDFGYLSKPTILGVGHLGALIFLLLGIRSGSVG